MRYLLLFLLTTFSLTCQQNFILIGPPGSGKGTFSSYMQTRSDYVHICPGNILRAHIRNKTILGKAIKSIVEQGQYIDDRIVFEIIKKRISDCTANNKPFIIDGFPRNTAGYNFLIRLFKEKNIEQSIQFIHFNISDETCIDRIEKRLVCFGCSHVFNTTTKKPKRTMTCDKCGDTLEVRLGDHTKNTIKRLAYFRKNIEPLIKQAQKKYTTIQINAAKSLEECLLFYQRNL